MSTQMTWRCVADCQHMHCSRWQSERKYGVSLVPFKSHGRKRGRVEWLRDIYNPSERVWSFSFRFKVKVARRGRVKWLRDIYNPCAAQVGNLKRKYWVSLVPFKSHGRKRERVEWLRDIYNPRSLNDILRQPPAPPCSLLAVVSPPLAFRCPSLIDCLLHVPRLHNSGQECACLVQPPGQRVDPGWRTIIVGHARLPL